MGTRNTDEEVTVRSQLGGKEGEGRGEEGVEGTNGGGRTVEERGGKGEEGRKERENRQRV